MILLTLALPVYNGESCIKASIESIKEALLVLSVKDRMLIDIVVSDNQSTDLTKEVIHSLITDNFLLKYYCNENNVGYDGNIDLIVERARGKYVWFLGCGETLKEDSLIRLMNKLNNNIDYSNILLDFDIYDERKNIISDKCVFTFRNDILITEKNDFSQMKYSPAVSSNIINRKKWNQVKEEILVVSGWCHIERILSIIALDKSSNTLLLVNPYFTLFREKEGWWTKPDSYLLLLLHIKVIKSMESKGYSKKIIKILVHKQSRIALLMAIVQSKEYGMKLNSLVLKKMLELFRYDYYFWLFAFPLLILPNSMMFIPRNIFVGLKIIKRIILNVK